MCGFFLWYGWSFALILKVRQVLWGLTNLFIFFNSFVGFLFFGKWICDICQSCFLSIFIFKKDCMSLLVLSLTGA